MINKAVQSVWFDQSLDGIDYSGGWLTPALHLMSWALSSCQLPRYFGHVELVTDKIGAELAGKLHLPYTTINTDLEAAKYKHILWVSNKLYTYSLQDQPFIHVDTDAYLFKKLSCQLLLAPLVAQNAEYDHDDYVNAFADVHAYCRYIPSIIIKDITNRLTAVNAGIIGGNEVSFFKELAVFTNDFIEQNKDSLYLCRPGHINVLVEQFLFRKYAELKNIPIRYFTPIEIGPPPNYQMADFVKLPDNCSYIHVMNYKRNPTVCEQMAQRLWLESPDFYERVLTVCRELEAAHHPISLPTNSTQIQNPFYRTQYLLNSIQSQISPSKSAEGLSAFIDTLPENQSKIVINDIFQYENRRCEFIQTLPNSTILKQYWHTYSQQANDLLSLPIEECSRKQIRQSQYYCRIDSEWNWAEVNEFTAQDAYRNFAYNLQIESAYYETVLYVYTNQGLVREHLLDTLNILVLDALEEPSTIESVIYSVSDQILSYQSQMDQQELGDMVMNRIRHFLYHGVLEVV